ncbi:MAG: 50S ribosomal protein L35 [Eubacteriales bacterium]|jgi:large subunit ribosomal protein L35
MATTKIKTKSSAKKRFSVSKNGKVKRSHAFRSHILTKKSTKRKRGLRQAEYLTPANEATIKSLIPYKC